MLDHMTSLDDMPELRFNDTLKMFIYYAATSLTKSQNIFKIHRFKPVRRQQPDFNISHQLTFRESETEFTLLLVKDTYGRLTELALITRNPCAETPTEITRVTLSSKIGGYERITSLIESFKLDTIA